MSPVALARLVLAHIVLSPDYQLNGLETLDEMRAESQRRLQEAYPGTILDMLFTPGVFALIGRKAALAPRARSHDPEETAALEEDSR